MYSIIMPVGKKHLKYVYEAVKSVIDQSHPEWRLWIYFDIKDAEEEIYKYRILDNRINVLWDGKVKKQTIRRNEIIEQITDPYTCFLDADDVFLPNRLEMVNHLIGNRFTWSYGDCINFDDNREWYFKPKKDIVADDFIESCCGIPIGSVTIRTDILKRLRFDENLRIGEDWNLYYRLWKLYVPDYIPKAHYKKRVGSSTCRHFPHSLYRWRTRRYMRKIANEKTSD